MVTFLPQGRGDSLTFGTGVLMSRNFLRPQIIRPTFAKTPNNQLSSVKKILDTKKMAQTVTYQRYQTPNNLTYPKFQPTDSNLGPRNFRPQIISSTPNCRPQRSTLAPPFQKSRSSPPDISSLTNKSQCSK